MMGQSLLGSVALVACGLELDQPLRDVIGVVGLQRDQAPATGRALPQAQRASREQGEQILVRAGWLWLTGFRHVHSSVNSDRDPFLPVFEISLLTGSRSTFHFPVPVLTFGAD